MDSKNPEYIGFDEFYSIVANAADGFLLVDLTGHILDANASYCQMTGYTRDELLNMHLSEIDPIDDVEDVARRAEEIIQAGSLRFESKHRHKSGVPIDVEISSNYTSLHGGSFVSFIREITSQKRTREIIDARLRLMEYSINHSVDELLRETLDEAEKLTGSCIGFYHFLDSDQQTLTLRAWSTQTVNKFCKAEGTGSHYHISQAGVWVDCVREGRPVIHNDYASLPHRKGMPEGHAFLVRELVVPVFRKGTIVAILGIGNKPTDYDERDIELVTLLADMAFSVFEHKQFEESNRYLSEVMKNLTEGVFLLRLDNGTIVFTNPRFEKMFGYNPGELIGKDVSIINAPSEQTPEETKTSIMQILAETGEWQGEIKNIRKDGSQFWCYANVSIFDSSEYGRVTVSVHTDITDRKQSEEALRDREEHYRALFSLAGEGICSISQQGLLLEVNEAFAQMHGYTKQEMVGMNIRDLDTQGGVEEFPERSQLLQSGKIITFEVAHYHKEGTVFTLEATVSQISLAGDTFFLCFHRNISERKQYEESLKKSEEKFRTLFDQSQDAVFLTIPDGHVVRANSAACKIFGMTEQELCELGRDGIVDSSDARLESALEERKRTGKLFTELTCIRKNGEKFPAEVSSVIITTEPPQSFVIIRDISERKKAELALQKVSLEMQRLLETAATGLTRCSRDLHYISVNPAYANLAGVPLEQIIGRPIKEVMGEEGLSAIMPYVERVLTGERVEYETAVHFKGSGGRYLHVIYTPDDDGQGNIIGWVASITDITERKLAENAIKESNANFSSLAANVPGFVALVEAKTLKYQYVNDEYVKSFGMPRDKIIGSHIKEVLSEANYQYALPYIEEVRSGKSTSYEMTFNLTSGRRWVQVHFNPVFDDNGQVVSITVLSYDVTEKKQSQIVLQESEERYRKFSQLTSDFVHRCQRSSGEPFRIKWMGGAVEKITGYSQEEVFAKGCWLSLVHPEDRQRISDMLLGLAPGDTSKNEFRIITKSGEIGWLYESLLCEAGDGPGQLVLYGTSQDITDKKRAEEEHQILEKQLQQTQRLESLGVLAGGIAHDFNNILAIIMGHCSLTEMDYDKAPDHIPEIEKAVSRAAELCRQMLAYAGKAQFVQAQVSIGKLVEDTVNMLKASIKKNVVIKPSIATDIPFIKADASQINQIAMNLIINGAEAIGDEQGEVKVTLSKISIIAGQSKKDYLGKIIPAGWYACLEVSDNGCGMNDETYNRIFEPFYTTKFTGRGLGMSAVLGIITAQGGAVQLSSQLGKGTTFKVYLPVQISDSYSDETAKLTDKKDTWRGSGTILLVEDEEQILQLAKAMLVDLGFSVMEARNGKEALELYQSNATEINLVWTDLGMPVMDGYALFSELKQRTPSLPIIISSGFGDADITSRISRDDIAGLVGKPYNFNLLRETLKNVFEGKL